MRKNGGLGWKERGNERYDELGQEGETYEQGDADIRLIDESTAERAV